MDDLLILDTKSVAMETLGSQVTDWLEKHRNQTLNHQKTKLVSLKTTGLVYLGFYLKQAGDPKEPLLILPTRKKKWNLVKALRLIERHPLKSRISQHPLANPNQRSLNDPLGSVNSHLGLIKHSKSYAFKRKCLSRTIEQTSHLEISGEEIVKFNPNLKITGNFNSLALK